MSDLTSRHGITSVPFQSVKNKIDSELSISSAKTYKLGDMIKPLKDHIIVHKLYVNFNEELFPEIYLQA